MHISGVCLLLEDYQLEGVLFHTPSCGLVIHVLQNLLCDITFGVWNLDVERSAALAFMYVYFIYRGVLIDLISECNSVEVHRTTHYITLKN